MFVGVLYFFLGGCFLDVLVVLDRFAILYYDFFCKKNYFCQKLSKIGCNFAGKITMKIMKLCLSYGCVERNSRGYEKIFVKFVDRIDVFWW